MTDTNRNASIQSIDQLLSASLDDLDDLPSFSVPPTGSYILGVSMEQKEINSKPAIEASFVVVETVELADKEETPAKAGDKFSMLFTLNEIGIGKLKEFCVPFAEHFGEKSIGTLVKETIKNVQVAATVKQRKDKTDPEKVYASVKILSIA